MRSMFFRVAAKITQRQDGQAVLVTVVFLAVVLVVTLGGITLPLVRTFQSDRDILKSARSYYAAESGSEDAAYRISQFKHYSPNYNLTIDDVQAAVTITENGSNKAVESRGDDDERIRTLSASLNLTTDQVHFFYGIQIGDGGLSMNNNALVNGNVYSNGNIIGSNGAIITGSAVVAGGITSEPSIEWATHDADYFFANSSANRDVAQSFIANATAQLNRTSVYLGKVGNPTANITVRITADNGNKPANSSLVTTVITPSMVGVTPSWINVSFSAPPNLTSGSKYWILLDNSSFSATNYWNWRKDSTDGYPNNTAKYTSACCSGNPTWTDVGGDLAFRVWLGGTNTKIDGLIIGDTQQGLGKANMFVNTTIHGSSCPNPYCVVDNPPREELPISAGVIQDWRDLAAAGGTCGPPVCDTNGNYSLNNNAVGSLGPIRVPGSLAVNNGSRLTITGTIWVGGVISLDNNSVIQLDAGYGPKSGVILTDSTASVNNNVQFYGSGQSGSYVMLLSAKDAPASVTININNNSEGVIYYASGGRLYLNNNALAREAVGYGISMNNGATITYESGLQNLFFSSGPGASFQINRWEEI